MPDLKCPIWGRSCTKIALTFFLEGHFRGNFLCMSNHQCTHNKSCRAHYRHVFGKNYRVGKKGNIIYGREALNILVDLMIFGELWKRLASLCRPTLWPSSTPSRPPHSELPCDSPKSIGRTKRNSKLKAWAPLCFYM